IVVLDDSRTRLRIDVQHLVGNATIAPVVEVTAVDFDVSDDDVEIRLVPSALGSRPAAALLTAERSRSAYAPRKPISKKWVASIAAIIIALFAITTFISLLQEVEVDVQPRDSRVSTPGTFLAFQSEGFLSVLSGKHVVHAEHDGYYPAQTTIDVKDNAKP